MFFFFYKVITCSDTLIYLFIYFYNPVNFQRINSFQIQIHVYFLHLICGFYWKSYSTEVKWVKVHKMAKKVKPYFLYSCFWFCSVWFIDAHYFKDGKIFMPLFIHVVMLYLLTLVNALWTTNTNNQLFFINKHYQRFNKCFKILFTVTQCKIIS